MGNGNGGSSHLAAHGEGPFGMRSGLLESCERSLSGVCRNVQGIIPGRKGCLSKRRPFVCGVLQDRL